jgi:uncharacterized RDD family membrane protein YckC
VAFVIDIAIVITVVAIISATSGLVNMFLNLRPAGLWVLRAITAMTSVIFGVGYYIALWVLVGMTPGKRIMGLIIVGEDGGRVTIGKAIRRYVGYYLSSILLLGYLWVLIDPRRQALHDKLAGTLVIYDWPDSILASLQKGENPRWGRNSIVRRRQDKRSNTTNQLPAQPKNVADITPPIAVSKTGQ